MAERIARDLFPGLLHCRDDLAHAGALGDEQIDGVVLVHDRPQPPGFLGDIERPLRNKDGVDVPARGGIVEPFGELRLAHPLVMRERGGGGEPAAVAPHDLVDDEHSRVR